MQLCFSHPFQCMVQCITVCGFCFRSSPGETPAGLRVSPERCVGPCAFPRFHSKSFSRSGDQCISLYWGGLCLCNSNRDFRLVHHVPLEKENKIDLSDLNWDGFLLKVLGIDFFPVSFLVSSQHSWVQLTKYHWFLSPNHRWFSL